MGLHSTTVSFAVALAAAFAERHLHRVTQHEPAPTLVVFDELSHDGHRRQKKLVSVATIGASAVRFERDLDSLSTTEADTLECELRQVFTRAQR